MEFRLDNFFFEESVTKILSEVYDLKEYIVYPYFNVGFSEKKRKNVLKVYYDIIDFKIKEINEAKSQDNKDSKKQISNKEKKQDTNPNKEMKLFPIAILDDIKTYMTSFQGIPMIFNKKEGSFDSVTILSKNFDFFNEYKFIKSKEFSKVSIPYKEIDNSSFELKKKIQEKKYIINSSEDKDKIETSEKEVVLLEMEYKNLQDELSEPNIRKKLNEKGNELNLLEKEYNSNKEKESETIKNNEDKKKKITEEINNLKKLLNEINITISKADQEFDGFYFSSKEITLKNTIGDSLTIPAKKPIIVEVKNNSSYKKMLENIKDKKMLLNFLGFNVEGFYFVGILRNINIDKERKKEINKIFKQVNFNNMIIIYPDKLNFLGVSLHKKNIKERENNKEKQKINEEEKQNEKNGVQSSFENEMREFMHKIILRLETLEKETKDMKSKISQLEEKIK